MRKIQLIYNCFIDYRKNLSFRSTLYQSKV